MDQNSQNYQGNQGNLNYQANQGNQNYPEQPNIPQQGNYPNVQQQANYSGAQQQTDIPSAQPENVYPQTQPQPEIPESTPVKKKPKKSPLKLILVLLIVAALAVGGFFAYQAFTDKDTSTDDSVSDVPADWVVLELYPDREVSKSDLNDFADLLEERAAVLGKNYEIDVDNSKITLTIDKNLLGETANERTSTVELLVSRGNISFGTDGYIDYYTPTKDEISEITVTEFDRQEVLKKYSLSLIDERYEQIDEIRTEQLFGLEIQLNNSGKEKLQKINDNAYSEPKLSIVHDYLEDTNEDKKFFGSVLLTSKGDASAAYVISPGAAYQKNAELMKKVLEQGECDFGLVLQIASEPIWETDIAVLGDNQVTSMDGETVVVEYSPGKYARSYNSETDYAEYAAIVKERLDVLDIDYMFGTTGFDDKTYCARVYPKDIAPDFFRLIFGDKQIAVYSAFDSISEFTYPELIMEDGKPKLRMETYTTAAEIVSEYNIPNNTVYLVVNDVTIASADITNIQEGEDNYLDFTNFTCFGNIEVGEEELNVLELICSIGDNQYTSFDGTFRFRHFGANESEGNLSLGDLEWKYAPLTQQDEIVFGILEGMCYDVQKLVDSRNMLVITLDIPVDENLPVNFLNKVKEIFAACNFDGGAYAQINFVIKDEQTESPANKFRLIAEKDTYGGKMEINDYVGGPKFGDYWSDVYDLMAEDPFFVERSY